MAFKEKINTHILELLLQFDFFFFESKNNFNDKRLIIKKTKITEFNKNKTFITINPLEFLKSLKRVIRVFQFLKSNKSVKIVFDFKNEYSLKLLKHLFEKNTPQLNDLLELETHLKIDLLDNTSKAYFFFNSLLKDSCYINLIRTNKYLISEFSNKNNFLKEFGNYKMFANFNDSKKMIFLILLLKNIYK